MSTVPPPASPETSTFAPANRPTFSPSTWTVPPVSPASSPEASSVPDTATIPASPPVRTIWPFCSTIVLAWMTPDMLMTLSTMPCAAATVKTTLPPSAVIWPELVTSAPSGSPFSSTIWRMIVLSTANWTS